MLTYAVEGWQSVEISTLRHNTTSIPKISVIIPIHQKETPLCLDEQLKPLLSAHVPIIIVNDHSTAPITCSLQGVTIINNAYPQGKKYALRCGIEYAQTQYVVTTDADVILHSEWIPAIQDRLSQSNVDMLILPLKMKSGTFLANMQETEYVALQTLTGGFALAGNPIMCSGANLVINRQWWLASWDYIRPDIPSGDDMFMLHSFKQRGLKIDFLKSQSAILTINPAPSLSSLFRQRTRWAGKANHYTDRPTFVAGAIVVFANLAVIVFPPMVLIKWLIDLNLLLTSKYFFTYKNPVTKSLLLSVVYPFYILTTLILIPFRGEKW